jgi:hypothetical protein
MYDPIVKDSSIWQDENASNALYNRDTGVKIGIVRSIEFNEPFQEIRYLVEVASDNDVIPVTCTPMMRFGGAHNFEEHIYRGYETPVNPSSYVSAYKNRPGDLVVVALLDGDGREGILLGGLQHVARPSTLSKTDGIAFASRFNGMLNTIDSDGEWTLTFNGKATNEDKLRAPSTTVVPAPTYDNSIAGTFMKFAKDGGWELSDSANSPQSIKIDKQGGTTTITSGNITLILNKEQETCVTTCKKYTLDAADLIAENTKEFKVNAQTKISLQGPKVAIGTKSVELMDQLNKLITALGNVFVMTPVGPSSPLSQSPLWVPVKQIQTKINSINGTLG